MEIFLYKKLELTAENYLLDFSFLTISKVKWN